jgi:hypothetical protein
LLSEAVMNHLAPGAAFLLTALSCAQAADRVVPAAFAAIEGNALGDFVFGLRDAQAQLLVDAAELRAARGSIQALRLRADNNFPFPRPYSAHAKAYRLTAHTTPVTAAQMTIDPVANRGATVGTVVFQGVLNVPASAYARRSPRLFELRMPFPTPYGWQAAQGNVLLHLETADLVAPPREGWRVDWVSRSTTSAQGLGALISNGCHNQANASVSLTVDPTNLVVGGSMTVQAGMTNLGAFPVGVLLLGFDTQWFAQDLSPLGMPFCALDVEPFFAQLLTPAGYYYPLQTLQVPNDPRLTDVAVFTQVLGWAQPPLTFADSVTSPAAAAVIGSAQAPPAAWQTIVYDPVRQAWSFGGGPGTAAIPVLLFEGPFS